MKKMDHKAIFRQWQCALDYAAGSWWQVSAAFLETGILVEKFES